MTMNKKLFYYSFRNEYLINAIEYYSKVNSLSRKETIDIFQSYNMETVIDNNIDVIQQLDLDKADQCITKLLKKAASSMSEETLENISNILTKVSCNSKSPFLKTYSDFLKSSTYDKLLNGLISNTEESIFLSYIQEKGLTLN